jgi:hypothetical protein
LKTNQFAQNLLGDNHGATIDMWAARSLRQAGYEGYQDRWRILPENETGVSDTDFEFGQKVFAEAAKRVGLEPDALQGAMWFLEKKHWADQGWSPQDFGSYHKDLEAIEAEHPGQDLSKVMPRELNKRAKQATLF